MWECRALELQGLAVGFAHLQASYAVTVGDGPSKAILNALAFHACDTCGLCWPGVAVLAAETEYGPTRVRASLTALTASGHVQVARYPYGGRGLSTEYVVLPQVPKLSTAPCGECLGRMKNPPQGGAFAGGNPPQGGAFSGNPPRNPSRKGRKAIARVETNSQSTDQQSGVGNPGSAGSEPLFAPPHPTADPSTIPAASLDALRGLGILKPEPEPRS